MSDLLLPVSPSIPPKITFTFLRHGQSCHNLLHSKYPRNPIFHDAFLSDFGVQRSLKTGTQLYEYNKHFDIIGSSPSIRAMETAILMTRMYSLKDIFIFPYLRECSCKPSDTIVYVNKSYPIKSYYEQIKYLFKTYPEDIHLFNDRYSQTETREEPGNILNFVRWFYDNIPPRVDMNVLILCHSNVIREFTGSGVVNNDGFVLETHIDNGLKYKITSKIRFPKESVDTVQKDTKCVLKTNR